MPTKAEKKLKTLIDKPVFVQWNDPSSVAGWNENPLMEQSVEASTLGWFVGLNEQKELVIAGTTGEGACDLSIIPFALVSSIDEISLP